MGIVNLLELGSECLKSGAGSGAGLKLSGAACFCVGFCHGAISPDVSIKHGKETGELLCAYEVKDVFLNEELV